MDDITKICRKKEQEEGTRGLGQTVAQGAVEEAHNQKDQPAFRNFMQMSPELFSETGQRLTPDMQRRKKEQEEGTRGFGQAVAQGTVEQAHNQKDQPAFRNFMQMSPENSLARLGNA